MIMLLLSLLPLLSTSIQAQSVPCIDFGVATRFSVFTAGVFQPDAGTSLQQKLAVSGNALLPNWFSIGDQLTNIGQCQQDTVLIGQSLLGWASGRNFYGNIAIRAGYANVGQVLEHGCTIQVRPPPVDFQATYKRMLDVSRKLAALPTTVTGVSVAYGALSFTYGGGGRRVEVYNIANARLFADTVNHIYAPGNLQPSAILVFNIFGSAPAMTGGNHEALANLPVIYNFPEATSLDLRWITARGYVLAPNADVRSASGTVYGNVFVKSLVGGALAVQVGKLVALTDSCLPVDEAPVVAQPAPPPPASTSTAVVAVVTPPPPTPPPPPPPPPLPTTTTVAPIAVVVAPTLVTPMCIQFGDASRYNVFLLANYQGSSDVQGKLAAGGDVSITAGFSLADQLTQIGQCQQDTLVVGGTLLQWPSGRNYFGNMVVGNGYRNVGSVLDPGCTLRMQPNPIPFVSMHDQVRRMSLALAGVKQTFTSDRNSISWKTLTLRFSGVHRLEVYSSSDPRFFADAVNHVNPLQNIPTTFRPVLVFNIFGKTAAMVNGNHEALAAVPVIYNFPEAETLEIRGIAVRGWVVAPLAVIRDATGVVWGNVFAKSMSGPIQVNVPMWDVGIASNCVSPPSTSLPPVLTTSSPPPPPPPVTTTSVYVPPPPPVTTTSVNVPPPVITTSSSTWKPPPPVVTTSSAVPPPPPSTSTSTSTSITPPPPPPRSSSTSTSTSTSTKITPTTSASTLVSSSLPPPVISSSTSTFSSRPSTFSTSSTTLSTPSSWTTSATTRSTDTSTETTSTLETTETSSTSTTTTSSKHVTTTVVSSSSSSSGTTSSKLTTSSATVPSLVTTHTPTTSSSSSTPPSPSTTTISTPCTTYSPNVPTPICVDFGAAQRFNVFVKECYEGSSDVQGRLAAGGNVTLAPGFSLGDQLSQIGHCQEDILVSGGYLREWQSGRNYFGNILVRQGYENVGAVLDVGCTIRVKEDLLASAVDLPGMYNHLVGLSDMLSKLAETVGIQVQDQVATLTFSGNRRMEVWNIQQPRFFPDMVNHLAPIQNIAPFRTLLIVNIFGSACTLFDANLEAWKDIPVIFNFVHATRLEIRGIAVRGHVLAPFADIADATGVVWGNVYAKSMRGPIQVNLGGNVSIGEDCVQPIPLQSHDGFWTAQATPGIQYQTGLGSPRASIVPISVQSHTPTNAESQPSESGVNPWLVVGIVAAVATALAGAYYLYRRHLQNRQTQTAATLAATTNSNDIQNSLQFYSQMFKERGAVGAVGVGAGMGAAGAGLAGSMQARQGYTAPRSSSPSPAGSNSSLNGSDQSNNSSNYSLTSRSSVEDSAEEE